MGLPGNGWNKRLQGAREESKAAAPLPPARTPQNSYARCGMASRMRWRSPKTWPRSSPVQARALRALDDGADKFAQFIEHERLGDHVHARAQEAVARGRLLGVAGHEPHRQSRGASAGALARHIQLDMLNRLRRLQTQRAGDQRLHVNAQIRAPGCHDRLRARGYLTVDEIAEKLGVCSATVKVWAREGLLQGHPYTTKNECLYELPAADAIPTKQPGRKLHGRNRLEKVLLDRSEEVHLAV